MAANPAKIREIRSDHSSPAPAWIVRALMVIAVAYAFLAGLRTLNDFDLGWQLATGRWIVQHHQVPSTDVFSYTAYGQPWIYPALSELILYAIFLLGGYALLSWAGAFACASSVALLLRRGNLLTAVLALLSVPLIVARTAPRAEMFTVVLFSAYLCVIWEYFKTGRSRLWLLPALMLLWVNLHLGFVAGLALLGAYVGFELLEMLLGDERRSCAIERLRRSWFWLLASVAATLVNPWGWNLYRALIRQNQAMAQHAQWIGEWSSTPLNWSSIVSSFSLHDTKGAFLWLMIAALLAIVVAAASRQPGPGLLLASASYLAIRHIRFKALFCCVVVIVGGSILANACERVSARWQDARMKGILAAGSAALFAVLAIARSADLVKDRQYLASSDPANFGAGLSWWFPDRALAFIEQQKLPPQIFNNYNLGGFLVWRLGEKYRNYVDGRAIPFGPDVFERQYHLMRSDPDAGEWRRTLDKLGINTLVLSLARYNGEAGALPKFCASRAWKLVYIDEVAAVFLRATAGNEPLIRQFGLDCASFTLPPPPATRVAAFNYWANSMLIMHVLGRNAEAWESSDRALKIFPDNSHLHFIRASILNSFGNLDGAEQEYLTALGLEPKDLIWVSLAALYRHQARNNEADLAMRKAVDLSAHPHQILLDAAWSYVQQRRATEALAAVDEALRRAPPEAALNHEFQANVLRTRAAAWNLQGNNADAEAAEQEATRLLPEHPDVWLELAQLYESHGRHDAARRARETADTLAR